MKPPSGMFTIAEAAEKWISILESTETDAPAEEKAALIAKIRAAAPKAKITMGISMLNDRPVEKVDFIAACNYIRAVIRSAK